MVVLININENKRLKMTLKDWIESSYLSIENIIMNSSSDNVDKKGDDAMIDEPIGISHNCEPRLLYKLINSSKEKKNMVLTAFRVQNDARRRGNCPVNRNSICSILSKKNINNSNIGNNFYWRLLDTKFVISPEGNGIDCHRHWESLYFGAIPIVERNEEMEKKLIGLPVLYTTDYSEINETYLKNIYDKMINTEYDFSRLIIQCYPKKSMELMIRRSNHWNSRRGKSLFYKVCLDSIIPNFYKEVSLITITNSGYLPITQNCIKSIDRLHINCPLKIFSIDKMCYEKLVENKYENLEFLGNIHEKAVEYCDDNWSLVTMQKVISIRKELEKSNIVVYIDGDIVVEDSRFITYCYEKLNENKDIDMLAQREWRGDNDKNEICTGFLAIRSNEKTKKFFEFDINKKERNDQHFVNGKRHCLNIELLPEELFPNGKFYYTRSSKTKLDPYLIHFNFVKSHDKIPKMKSNNKWYL
uniref:Nucleotide-diphospho-sugar transferase domain-containing protein n=1 Tax=viral metagenome TaxID=1070528 RepID=A0A6C0AHC2_9ZZZZ|tara:strand:+ start:2165 stop:3580 length:1416 start_codon:yes stop_codon:yes gene_type:complete